MLQCWIDFLIVITLCCHIFISLIQLDFTVFVFYSKWVHVHQYSLIFHGLVLWLGFVFVLFLVWTVFWRNVIQTDFRFCIWIRQVVSSHTIFSFPCGFDLFTCLRTYLHPSQLLLCVFHVPYSINSFWQNQLDLTSNPFCNNFQVPMWIWC